MNTLEEAEGELNAYKNIVKIAEQLLNNAGIPDALMNKFHLVKSLTLKKFRKFGSGAKSSSRRKKRLGDEASSKV